MIDGIEQIVFEQGDLLGQRGVEEPVLVRGGGDHSVLDDIEYDRICQVKRVGARKFPVKNEMGR
ncbi:MAG TPA: hypothetical protein VGD41_14445 [Pyrinomonadaceae bacterium]